MRASKLLLALGLTAGVLAQVDAIHGDGDNPASPPGLSHLNDREAAVVANEPPLRPQAEHDDYRSPVDKRSHIPLTDGPLNVCDEREAACVLGIDCACDYEGQCEVTGDDDNDDPRLDDLKHCLCTHELGWDDYCENDKDEKRDVQQLSTPRASMPDGYYLTQQTNTDSKPPATDAVDALQKSLRLLKRSEQAMPTKKGQAVTRVRTASNGDPRTFIISLQETSPTVEVVKIVADSSTATVIASAMTDNPHVLVESIAAYGFHIVKTRTFKGNLFHEPTVSHAKRSEQTPQTTSTKSKKVTTTERSKPHTGKKTSTVSKHTSPSTKVSEVTSSTEDDDEPASEQTQTETVSILDEEPGQTTLNPAAATQKLHATTQVTVIERHGTALTLTPTTNAQGHTVLVTEDLDSSHKETCTVSIFINSDKIVSRYSHCSRTGQDIVTETTRIVQQNDIVAPFAEQPTPITTMAVAGEPSTVIKVITHTVTKYPGDRQGMCCGRDNWYGTYNTMLAMTTMVDLGSTTVPFSKQGQLLNNGTVLSVLPQAQGTLVPVVWDPRYLNGWEHIMEMDLASIRAMYPEADWDEVPRMAYQLRKSQGDLDPERCLKYALVLGWLRHHPHQYAQGDWAVPSYPTLSTDRAVPTKMLARIPDDHVVTTAASTHTGSPTNMLARSLDGHVVTMTASTQTISGQVYVIDPMWKYKMYDPYHHAVAPTKACVGDNKHHGNKTGCKVERCMWEYMKPINITTVQPMAMYDRHGDVNYNWFTHTTQLHRPHWGTTEEKGLYYPATLAWRVANGTESAYMARQTPGDLPEKISERVHGDPECWDIASCFDKCDHEHHHSDKDLLMKIGLPILAALAALALLSICCFLIFRRRRRNPERRKSSTITEKFRRRSSHPQEVIVNTTTGETTDTAGHPVDPTTAAVAQNAAGAPVTSETGQPDGRGTTGRRAEEGRGRVNFEDGSRPGGEGTEVSPTEHTEGPATESTAPQPVPDKDGATGTGRQTLDVGSMRGRKKSRPEGAGGFGLGF